MYWYLDWLPTSFGHSVISTAWYIQHRLPISQCYARHSRVYLCSHVEYVDMRSHGNCHHMFSRSVTYLDPTAFPTTTTIVYGTLTTAAPTAVLILAPTTLSQPSSQPSVRPSCIPSLQPSSNLSALVPAPTIQYCSCTTCCGCSHVIIPTDVTSIADNAFLQCGGGNLLKAVIITT